MLNTNENAFEVVNAIVAMDEHFKNYPSNLRKESLIIVKNEVLAKSADLVNAYHIYKMNESGSFKGLCDDNGKPKYKTVGAFLNGELHIEKQRASDLLKVGAYVVNSKGETIFHFEDMYGKYDFGKSQLLALDKLKDVANYNNGAQDVNSPVEKIIDFLLTNREVTPLSSVRDIKESVKKWLEIHNAIVTDVKEIASENVSDETTNDEKENVIYYNIVKRNIARGIYEQFKKIDKRSKEDSITLIKSDYEYRKLNVVDVFEVNSSTGIKIIVECDNVVDVYRLVPMKG